MVTKNFLRNRTPLKIKFLGVNWLRCIDVNFTYIIIPIYVLLWPLLATPLLLRSIMEICTSYDSSRNPAPESWDSRQGWAFWKRLSVGGYGKRVRKITRSKAQKKYSTGLDWIGRCTTCGSGVVGKKLGGNFLNF